MFRPAQFLVPVLAIGFLTVTASAQTDFDITHGPGSMTNIHRQVQGVNSLDTLSGSVHWRSGTPAKNVTVQIVDLSTGQVVASGYTNDGGGFTIAQVPSGEFQIVAQYGTSEVRSRISVDSIDNNVTLTLPDAAAVTDAAEPFAVSVAQMKVPDKAREALKKAQKAVDKRDTDAAQKYIAEALKIDPTYAGALTLRGILSMDTKNNTAAENDFDEAIKCDNNYSLAYIAMGAAYNMDGKWNDAVRSPDRGLALNPKAWQANFEMAKSYLALKDYQRALSQLDQAQQINANYAPIHLLRAHTMLAIRNFDDAIAELEVYLQHDPSGAGSDEARETLGKVKAFVATKH